MPAKSRDQLKQEVKYPFLEYVFNQVDTEDNVDVVINNILQKVGIDNDLSMIAVKELMEKDFCIKCTYDWASDGKHELVDVEHRYYNRDEFTEWVDEFKEFGYITYNIEDGSCPVRITRNDLIISLIQIPMYVDHELVGCIDFIDSAKHRDWSSEEIDLFHKLSLVLSSYLLNLRDMKRAELVTRDLTEYDKVTGLPKYELFFARLDEMRKVMSDSVIDIICIDFSNLKYLNEKYGYARGNDLMVTFAREIYEFSDKIISCCRSYLDNFIIACKSDDNVNIDDMLAVLEQASAKIIEHFRDEYRDCNIIINAGVYIMRRPSDNLEQAISNAQLARKEAKNGKAQNGYRCRLYHAGMSFKTKRKADYIAQIDQALLNNDFIIQLQPKCMTDTFEIIGAEALVRWDTHTRNILYPKDFMDAFEEDGCIVKLDYYVYDKVFAYLWERMRAKKPVVPISVNVSIVHFYDAELVSFVRSLLKRYPIDTSYVEFELTEQIYTSVLNNVGKVIDELRELGFKIIIDNFGTGYSCLNTFTKYKIDGINLDRSFMQTDLEQNNKVIIAGVINMANRLNLEVLCEGVETEEQRSFLIRHECQYMQGNLFSKPVNIADFNYMLENQ